MITDFNQRVLFDERVIQEEGGIHHEIFQPFYAAWAHLDVRSGDDLHGDPFKLNIYRFVVRTTDRLKSKIPTIGRLHWLQKILHIHQMYIPPDRPEIIIGQCYERKEQVVQYEG